MTKTAKDAVFYVLMAIIGGILYRADHASATEFRGYEAIGGEAFMLLLPGFAYLIRVFIEDVEKMFREVKRNDYSGSSVPEQK